MRILLLLLLVAANFLIFAQTRVANTDIVNNRIHSIVRYNDNLFIAGSFTNVGGQPIATLAMLNAHDGKVRSWMPSPNNIVNDIIVCNGKLIVAGKFTTILGQSRANLAIFDAATGILL